jgi:hypothetical protein
VQNWLWFDIEMGLIWCWFELDYLAVAGDNDVTLKVSFYEKENF